MTVQASPVCATIVQGATFEESWERTFYPYPTKWECGVLVKACSGEPAPDADRVLEDYTGCTAEANLIHPDTGAVIATISTATGEIILAGATMRLLMSYTATAAFQAGAEPPAWKWCTAEVFVTRANGKREKQYEVTLSLEPKDVP